MEELSIANDMADDLEDNMATTSVMDNANICSQKISQIPVYPHSQRYSVSVPS